MNNVELLAALKEKGAVIDVVMKEDLAIIESPLLAEIIHHAIFQGGKRIRPLLTLLAASLIGPPPPETTRLAISFEYLHAASLLHDDVIDHAILRRGAETANTIWGMEPVILAGDYLHAHAMALASEVGGPAAMALIGRCDAFVTNDSGLMHVAAAQKTPLVAIFGSTDAVATGPFASKVEVVNKNMPCSPCLETHCPRNDLACMLEIGVDEVYAAICRLLESEER